MKITEMVKTIVSESNGRFGKFDVTNMNQIIPKYRKELQSYLNKNRGGKLYGIASGGLSEGKLMIIGETAIITIDMNTMMPLKVTLINK
jgi:hypothetical protein